MATPRPPYYGQRNVDPSRHSYTGGHIRQRLRNIVGNYVDAKLGVGTPVPGPATSPRMVHDRFAQEEESNKIDARDIAAVSGDEEKLVLFPTYARVKPHLFHVLHQHGPTSEHVDIELHVHGQLSMPHTPNAPLRRKDRLILSVARQICGLPALPSAAPQRPGLVTQQSIDIFNRFSGRTTSSAPSSPDKENLSEIVDAADLIDMNTPADSLSIRSQGSEKTDSTLHIHHATSFPILSENTTQQPPRANSMPPSPSRPRSSGSSVSTKSSNETWKNSHNFPLLDLATCHANLLDRLSPFIARSISGQLVTVKVYAPPSADKDRLEGKDGLEGREVIAHRQFLTNEYGHFMGRLIVSPPGNRTAPETWTITATFSSPQSDKAEISVREELKFIPEQGISLISDIDDTVKHTSILSGTRELFRNTFVRDLKGMSIAGVKEWYTALASMGISIHYVSNAPYQCWPIVSSFMKINGLPRGGSIHLKQYSGMISGIWENAAEKKRAGVETIVRDFPRRRFILVGDSGEQDLELYTDIALSYQDQVLGIFIRDVTTPLLTTNTSTSSCSLPLFFDGNGLPHVTTKQGRLTQLKSFRDSFRTKSQDHVPTLSALTTTGNGPAEPINLDTYSLAEIETLSPLFAQVEEAGEGIINDLPDRKSKTPPPMQVRPMTMRSTSSASITSLTSEPGGIKTPERTVTAHVAEDQQTVRVKRVENWKRRLERARERLELAGSGVEIWTWRVGADVQSICEELIVRSVPDESQGGNQKFGVKEMSLKLRESTVI